MAGRIEGLVSWVPGQSHYYWPATAQAGNKRCLAESAAYPRGFGLALAGLVGERGVVPGDGPMNMEYPEGHDLDALKDLFCGGGSTWWRKL